MKKSEWYKQSIESLLEKTGSISKAFDIKYGNFDYSKDLRAFTEPEFKRTFVNLLPRIANRSLIVGSNSGYEIDFIPSKDIFALDISKVAIDRLKERFGNVDATVGNMMDLPYKSDYFDLYVNMRSITSYGVDRMEVISEAQRVLRPGGISIVSFSNGYINDQLQVQHGMYSREEDQVSTALPFNYVTEHFGTLSRLGYCPKIFTTSSEILIVTQF